MKGLRIKNWEKFQHFKDRRPPWIKLYRDIMDDVEWHELKGNHAKALIALWLIASENDGNLPEIRTLAFRLRCSESAIKEHLQALSHWLIHDDINMISGRYQGDTPETETETEESREEKTPLTPQGGAAKTPTASWATWTNEDFERECIAANHDNLLADDELRDFVEYWTEPTKRGKPKFQAEKTWSTRRRMQTALRIVFAKDRKGGQAAKPLSIWELNQKKDMLKAQIKRHLNSYQADDIKAKKAIRAQIEAIDAQIAGYGTTEKAG